MPNRMALFLVKDVVNLKTKICSGTPIPEQNRNLIWSTDIIHRKQVYYYHLGSVTEMVSPEPNMNW